MPIITEKQNNQKQVLTLNDLEKRKEVEHNSGRKFFITIPWERSGFPQPSCNSVAHATVFLTLL